MRLIKPENGYIVVEPLEEGETLAGAIILPDLGQERPAMGKVLAVSDKFFNLQGYEIKPESVSVGDTVLIPRVGSIRVKIDNKEYFMCKQTEVLGKLI